MIRSTVKPDEPLLAQIEWLLTSPMVKIRGSNFKYDLIWIAEKWGIECTNFKFDNALVGSLVDENRSNGLDTHAKAMSTLGGYADEFNDTVDKNHMELVELPKLLPYGAGDLDAAYQVADVLRDRVAGGPTACPLLREGAAPGGACLREDRAPRSGGEPAQDGEAARRPKRLHRNGRDAGHGAFARPAQGQVSRKDLRPNRAGQIAADACGDEGVLLRAARPAAEAQDGDAQIR